MTDLNSSTFAVTYLVHVPFPITTLETISLTAMFVGRKTWRGNVYQSRSMSRISSNWSLLSLYL